jgi:hypothetical protein
MNINRIYTYILDILKKLKNNKFYEKIQWFTSYLLIFLKLFIFIIIAQNKNKYITF